MAMFPQLPSGIPLWQNYKNLVFHDDFGELTIHAEMFLEEQIQALEKLPFRYKYDHLQQWNKQWELPFVLQQAQQHIQDWDFENGFPQALDFGSDLSFFPWYFQGMTASKLTCLVDQYLVDQLPLPQAFSLVTLAKDWITCQPTDLFLPQLSAETYDLASCIGCHRFIGQLPQIIAAIYASLKPGGKFMFTFDIALIGKNGLDASTATDVLRLIDACFGSDLENEYSFEKINKQKNIVSTRYVAEMKPLIMPWSMSSMAYLLGDFTQSSKWAGWPANSTVFCGAVMKG
ncbi:hypothetical protein [Pelagibaculum spongiae]|uniref:Methyltransferase type 11 domain-containing protein n=1 Tax=Pelagibaculum spongiae TaxID=2080658 RepID=A0A2V1GUY6_9GAMM|nr:hypothetical protein [Pelagibaculum spongiae]PVZ68151.1 hypothetical protein DC094_12665 [Pelagibaculum spongiae]